LEPLVFGNSPSVDTFKVDLLPARSPAVMANPNCNTGLKTVDGTETVQAFSSLDLNVVREQFRSYKSAGLDVVELQRFVHDVSANPVITEGNAEQYKGKHLGNPEVAKATLYNAMVAAKEVGLKIYMNMDISMSEQSAHFATYADDIRAYLKSVEPVLKDDVYLKDAKGRPVVTIWGYGFPGRPGNPQEANDLMRDLRSDAVISGGFGVMAGVPHYWRSMSDDWKSYFYQADVIAPWSVGLSRTPEEAVSYYATTVREDIFDTASRNIGYSPSFFRGFSWCNMGKWYISHTNSPDNIQPETVKPDFISGRSGALVWSQVASFNELAVNTTIQVGGRNVPLHKYAVRRSAMGDELDESTAIIPRITDPAKLPAGTCAITGGNYEAPDRDLSVVYSANLAWRQSLTGVPFPQIMNIKQVPSP
jgi:hypothetical protein